MGLDMYLTKKTYIGHTGFAGPLCPHEVRERPYMSNDANPVAPGDECVAFPAIDVKAMPHLAHVKPERVKGIDEEIGYWRKANAIHQWFVDNVQEGKDECQSAYVSREVLAELLGLCKDALAKAVMVDTGETYEYAGETHKIQKVQNSEEIAEILPPTSGFFFGSTEIGEGYIHDLKHTVKVIEAVFAEDAEEQARTGLDYPSGDIYYRSSW